MAKKQTKQNKQNFIQTFLIITTIYLGIILFLRPGANNEPPSYSGQKLNTPEVSIQALEKANLEILDHDASQTLFTNLQKQIDEQVKAKKLTQEEGDALLLHGAVLVADTQLKAGVARNDAGRVRNAFQTLASLEGKHVGKPEWTAEYSLPRSANDSRFPWYRESAASLYKRVVEDLSTRNRTDYIWGFIPGGYYLIDGLVKVTGSQPGLSYALAAFLLAFLVRAAVFPLTQKQLMFGRQMSQLTPLVNDIKKRYEGKDQQNEMNQKVMELYREYGINPMAGCGPLLIQMPLFITIYQCMLRYQFEFQKGTFLWINKATAQAYPNFIAPDLGHRDVILIVLYGITMMLSTLMTPVSDPTQVKQQRLMGVSMSIMFTFMMFTGAFPVPAAFVLYWTFTNILAVAQSLRAYRMPLPPLQKVNAPGGGVYPAAGQSKWMQKLEELQRQAQQSQGQSGSSPKAEVIDPGDVKTGTPVKHKPKKRK